MKRALVTLIIISAIFVSCGDSKIEVQNTLLVVDTYPSNGAEISTSLNRIIVFFSSSLATDSIRNESFVLELVGELDIDVVGVPVKTELLSLSEDKRAVTIEIVATPLTAGSIYRLTINNVKSAMGDSLPQKYYKFFFVKSK